MCLSSDPNATKEKNGSARAPEEWPTPDERDAKTPDKWVHRHPELVRLTGIHPFNVEPSLPALMAHGHSTPASLHYVRNHGAVPVAWTSDAERAKIKAEWRVTARGVGMDAEKVFTMADLANLPYREFPCLLVCAGNRRKEQNMVKRTIGFNWGAAGLGMSTWGGCYLSDVLKACGASTDPNEQDGLHVCFRGPLKELPAGADGSYGTSLPLRYAMDKANDVILAFTHNGLELQPDHGFPLRIVIPGFIGGRMVKWLEDIEISTTCSQNHYHFKDNRVLPVNVTPESAEAEGWWFKPDYIINELNINSAIARPAHDEVVSSNVEEFGEYYEVSGYAYSGGGRKVIRVEVTLDNGKSWKLCADADVSHPPGTPTKAGKYWGWCTWKMAVPRLEVASAQTVRCRAWDAAMNTQPSNLTWNVMGMLNNPWFTVLMHKEQGGVLSRRAEHPTMPGQQLGGWMTDQAKLGTKYVDAPLTVDPFGPATTPTSMAATPEEKTTSIKDELNNEAPSNKASTSNDDDPRRAALWAALPAAVKARSISREELEKHAQDDDCWIEVKGVVFDATEYLEEHPGGAESITMLAGQDSTEDFEAIHSTKAWTLLEKYAVGVIETEQTSVPPVAVVPPPVASVVEAKATSGAELLETTTEKQTTLRATQKVELRLIEKETLTHNSYRLRFALPSSSHVLGLPTGKHALVYGRDSEGKLVARAYTPTTADNVPGYVDFVIKAYRPDPPKFPKGGALSQYLCDVVQVGQCVKFRGPLGHIEYKGRGTWTVGPKTFENVTNVGMLSGGTGITPMLQILLNALADEQDETQFSLIHANQTENDILCRAELDALAAKYPDRLHLWYTLDHSPSDWTYSTGFVTEDMIREHLPAPSASTLVASCGPPAMIKYACTPNLNKLGHAADQQLYF